MSNREIISAAPLQQNETKLKERKSIRRAQDSPGFGYYLIVKPSQLIVPLSFISINLQLLLKNENSSDAPSSILD